MAVSKTLTANGSHGYHKFSLVVTETATSTANNTSSITIKFTIAPISTGYDWEGYTGSEQPRGSVTVDGTPYSWSLSKYNGSSTVTLVNETQTVTHNNDGTKSISLSFSCTSGSTYYLPGSASKSGTLTLTTIPRASSFSVSNGTLGTAQTITVTKKNKAYTHTITATCGSQSQTVCTKGGDTDSTTNTVSWTPAAKFAQTNTSGTTVSVTLSLQTYNGNTAIGSEVTKTISCAIPSTVQSKISNVDISDSTGLAETFGSYIRGKSKVRTVITVNNGTTQAQGATVSKAQMTVGGSTYSSTTAATSYTFTSAALQSTGSMTVKSQITDTRGRKDTDTKTINVLAYSEPFFNTEPTIGRCSLIGQQYVDDDTGDYCEVNYNVGFTSIKPSSAELNTTRVTITYQASDAQSATTLVDQSTTLSGTQYFQASGDKSYLITITVVDTVGSRTKWTSRLSTAVAIIHFAASGEAMGIGKIAEEDGLDIGWDTWIKGTNILNTLFYKPGDTFSVNGMSFAGLVTSSTKSARFTIPVDKLLTNISTITVTTCDGGVRVPNGGYMNSVGDSDSWLSQSGVTVTATKKTDRLVNLMFESTTAFTNVSNNMPIVYNGSPLTLTFR